MECERGGQLGVDGIDVWKLRHVSLSFNLFDGIWMRLKLGPHSTSRPSRVRGGGCGDCR